MNKQKARAQRKHAKARALERFDLEVTDRDLGEMVRQIQSGEAQFVRKQSLRVSVFKVVVQDKPLIAVYDKKRNTIATVYPIQWEEHNDREIDGAVLAEQNRLHRGSGPDAESVPRGRPTQG